MLLVMGLVNLVLGGVVVPSTIGRAVRRGRRLRAAADGGADDQPVCSADARAAPGLTTWGAAWQAARSAPIAPAVCSSIGR